MAEDNVRKIKTTTVNIEDEKLQPIREKNEQLNQLANALGQAHIRRKELEDNVESLENDFKSLNQELRESLAELEKEYPRGNLDLQSGVLTINEEVVEEAQVETVKEK